MVTVSDILIDFRAVELRTQPSETETFPPGRRRKQNSLRASPYS